MHSSNHSAVYFFSFGFAYYFSKVNSVLRGKRFERVVNFTFC